MTWLTNLIVLLLTAYCLVLIFIVDHHRWGPSISHSLGTTVTRTPHKRSASTTYCAILESWRKEWGVMFLFAKRTKYDISFFHRLCPAVHSSDVGPCWITESMRNLPCRGGDLGGRESHCLVVFAVFMFSLWLNCAFEISYGVKVLVVIRV